MMRAAALFLATLGGVAVSGVSETSGSQRMLRAEGADLLEAARASLSKAAAVLAEAEGPSPLSWDAARDFSFADKSLVTSTEGASLAVDKETEEASAAFLLALCNDGDSAEWFSRVLAPPSSSDSPLLVTDILPFGNSRRDVYRAASRLLTFGYCSELDAASPQNRPVSSDSRGSLPSVLFQNNNELDDEDPVQVIRQMSGSILSRSNRNSQNSVAATATTNSMVDPAAPFDWAPARVAIAQKIMQQQAIRDANALAAGESEDPLAADRVFDQVKHTLFPMLRKAFRTSPELMQAAKKYQQAWIDSAAMLASGVDDRNSIVSSNSNGNRNSKGLIEESKEPDNNKNGNNKNNNLLSYLLGDNAEQQTPYWFEQLKSALYRTKEAKGGNGVGLQSKNNNGGGLGVGGSNLGQQNDQSKQQHQPKHDIDFNVGSSYDSQKKKNYLPPGNGESVMGGGYGNGNGNGNNYDLNRRNSFEGGSPSQTMLNTNNLVFGNNGNGNRNNNGGNSFTSANFGGGGGNSFGGGGGNSFGNNGGSFGNNFKFAEAGLDAEADADAEAEEAGSLSFRPIPVSAATGDRAVGVVLDAFLDMVGRPELSFLKDLVLFDADTFFCRKDKEESSSSSSSTGYVQGQQIDPSTFFVGTGSAARCNEEQKTTMARVYGQLTFRLLHLVAETVLAEDDPAVAKALKKENRKTRNELILLESFSKKDGGSSALGGGMNDGEDAFEKLMTYGAVKRGAKLNKKKARPLTQAHDYDNKKGIKNTLNNAQKTGKNADTIATDGGFNKNPLLNRVSSRPQQKDARLKGDNFLWHGATKKKAGVSNSNSNGVDDNSNNNNAMLLFEPSVADHLPASQSWPVDPRIYFAVDLMLRRADTLFEIAAVGDNVPLVPGLVPQSTVLFSQQQQENPLIEMLKNLGLIKGELPSVAAGSGKPIPSDNKPGLQLADQYRLKLYNLHLSLRKLLFGGDSRPTLPASVAQATKDILGPEALDIALADIKESISRRKAGFYAPSQAAWQALVEGASGDQVPVQDGPDMGFLAILKEDTELLSKVVLLAQMGAEHAGSSSRLLGVDEDADGRSSLVAEEQSIEDSARLPAVALRPPRILLAVSQMVQSPKFYHKVLMSAAPNMKKYAENAMLGSWDKREIKALATGVSYGSKTNPILAYSSIDAVLMPAPLNPASRDKSLPSDPALAKAEAEMKAGRLCAAVLSFTSKEMTRSKVASGGRLSFGRPATRKGNRYNHAQTVPEPTETRRHYVFCTQKASSENGFDIEATNLAKAMCAAAHNIGSLAQLQLEEWYKTQRYLNDPASRVKDVVSVSSSMLKKSAPAGKSVEHLSPIRGIGFGDPAKNTRPLPSFVDPQAQPRMTSLKSSFVYSADSSLEGSTPLDSRFGLDCGYLLRGAAVATYEVEQAELGAPAGQQQQQFRVAPVGPIPLGLAIMNTKLAEARVRASDRRFVTWASRFKGLHVKQNKDLFDFHNLYDHHLIEHEIEKFREMTSDDQISLEDRIFWGLHTTVNAGRKMHLSLGPETPVLHKAVTNVMKQPEARMTEPIVSDDGKLTLEPSARHTNQFAASYVDHRSRVVIVAFAGLGDLGENGDAKWSLAIGRMTSTRYKEGHKALKAVLDDFRGYQVVLTGFSFGGGVAIHLSKKYSLRAIVFDPAIFPSGSVTRKGFATLFYPSVSGGWRRGRPKRTGKTNALVAEILARFAYNSPKRGNGLITILSNAGDYASSGVLKKRYLARRDNDYEIVLLPALVKRGNRDAHTLRQFPILPLHKEDGQPLLPLFSFEEHMQMTLPDGGVEVGRTITRRMILDQLAAYQALRKRITDAGFEMMTPEKYQSLQAERAAEDAMIEERYGAIDMVVDAGKEQGDADADDDEEAVEIRPGGSIGSFEDLAAARPK